MSHIPFALKPEPLAELRHQAIEYREHHGDLLPDTTAWHFLEHKWSLNESRFEHWHPLIGKWIAEDWHLKHDFPSLPLIVETRCDNPPPCHLKPVATPEPSSAVMVVIGLCVVVGLAHLGSKGKR